MSIPALVSSTLRDASFVKIATGFHLLPRNMVKVRPEKSQ